MKNTTEILRYLNIELISHFTALQMTVLTLQDCIMILKEERQLALEVV
jgi:hypothetical protein